MQKPQTPLMQQYWDIKSLHQDKILLFRMGDFFEMFHDDAVKAAPILGITLTSRNKKAQDETPMCGVPHHSIAGPIQKLLDAGLRIAICEQIEDAKLAKGLVRRAVTRVLSPGMVFNPDTLDETRANYIGCFADKAFAALDMTTGEAFYFSEITQNVLPRLFAFLPIVELLSTNADLSFENYAGLVTQVSEELQHSPQQQGLPQACLRLLNYVTAQNPEQVLTLKPFEQRSLATRMFISSASYQHLEIFESNRAKAKGSLFFAVNRCRTAAGARLLRSRLSFPLIEPKEIAARHDAVERWVQDLSSCKHIRELLGQMGDIERRLGKISQVSCHARDLLSLADSLTAGMQALALTKSEAEFSAARVFELCQNLKRSLSPDAPLSTKQGHMIEKGVNAELDEMIELATNSSALVLQMEQREREKTGVASLKIRYNNVFGYFIEMTNSHKDKAPAHYLRKQTLTNAERYCTDELVELEKKVLSAQSRRFDLEFAIFEELRKSVLAMAREILLIAQATAELDVATASAWLAIERKYVRPQMQSQGLNLVHSRHPVVEQFASQFVPNTMTLMQGGCLLLTGPNMAGKSTLMRQVALIAIMAQSGLFVPAAQALLPIFQSLFTRIGASDQLSEGLSTFMVEMQESAEMLASANAHSLLILDEVGRGTSTFDGMSLAQAILEHIVQNIGAITFFATHYHELTSLELVHPQIRNAHIKVAEEKGEIRFLHTLALGPAQKSYGIQVARLAGIPNHVTKRAEKLLYQHESKQKSTSAKTTQSAQLELMPIIAEAPILDPKLTALAEEMKALEIANVTPLQALQKIHDWQKLLN